jgi:RNA polymerase sigma factor (sigma-70 family)
MCSEVALVRVLGRQYDRALKTRLGRGVWPHGAARAFDLDDLVQDTLLRAFTRRLGEDPIQDLARYLDAIARNILCDRARAARREARLARIGLEVAAVVPGPAAPDDVVGWRRLRRHLDQLPTPLWNVFRERYLLQNSTRQAAVNLAISYQTLRRRERQLILELRARLMLTRSELPEKPSRPRNRQRGCTWPTSG